MDLTPQAIQASLAKNRKLAIKLNLQILRVTPTDVDALNRLGKAFLSSGFKTKAETTYKKVLRIDKFNPIAQKGLETIKTFKVEHKKAKPAAVDFSAAFLEEPGTTKTVSLIRLGDSKILSHLQPGDEIQLQAREHCVSIANSNQEYLGRLPDDLASRLRPLIKSGNTYQAWVKSLAKNNLKIFIRELSRSAKHRLIPSFPSTEKLSYAAFTPPELVHSDRPRTSTPEEEDADDYVPEETLEADSESDSPPSTLLPPPDDD
jgi:hypothetical protein